MVIVDDGTLSVRVTSPVHFSKNIETGTLKNSAQNIAVYSFLSIGTGYSSMYSRMLVAILDTGC